MSKNVATLFGGPKPLEAIAPIVDQLEEALARAKNGETRAIALAESFDSNVGTTRTFTFWEHGHCYAINAAVDAVKYYLMQKVSESD